MTFLAIVAIGGIAIPLGERSFLPYARAAEQLWDKWVDAGLLPRRGAVSRDAATLGVRRLRQCSGDWAWRFLRCWCGWSLWALELALIGAGGGDGDGAADGGLLPSRNDVCGAHEYVERAAGSGAGSDGGRHVLRVARESVGWRCCQARRPRCCCMESTGVIGRVSRRACRGPAGSGAGVVDRVVGGRWPGPSAAGQCEGRVAGRGLRWWYCRSCCRDGVMAGAGGGFAGHDGSDGDRCGSGRFDPGGGPGWSDDAGRRGRARWAE